MRHRELQMMGVELDAEYVRELRISRAAQIRSRQERKLKSRMVASGFSYEQEEFYGMDHDFWDDDGWLHQEASPTRIAGVDMDLDAGPCVTDKELWDLFGDPYEKLKG